ncbi:MAG TPA: hypothetical protein PLF13_01435 [candidate division Zixibacteria bacterium]|nr:hypothetical protein [candidate division Zixibacteria bacterium]
MKDSLRVVSLSMVLIALALLAACQGERESLTNVEKLRAWQKGVWISGSGTYTVYTDDHYFVISSEGDSANANLYFAASQLGFYEQGMTRYQTVRLRKIPQGNPIYWKKEGFITNNIEVRQPVDTSLFDNRSCVVQDGVIYDAIIESTDTYILMATCGGDKIRLMCDGRSAYLPASGGEFWSYRVETL